jgi:alkaline phosphatase
MAAPDKNGTRLRFGIVWACFNDVAGGVIARAHGLNENMLHNNVDNTDIYRLMYATLFGRVLPAYIPGRE